MLQMEISLLENHISCMMCTGVVLEWSVLFDKASHQQLVIELFLKPFLMKKVSIVIYNSLNYHIVLEKRFGVCIGQEWLHIPQLNFQKILNN